MIYELAALGLLTVSLLLLAISLFQAKKKKEYLTKYIESMITMQLVSDRMDEIEKQYELAKMSESDGFVKFLSDSREWAFTYIEEVQEALRGFTEKAGPQIKYLNTYGELAPGPYLAPIKRISEAYAELEKSLPTTENTKND
jgi:SOS-response transcriptional repressor LexA